MKINYIEENGIRYAYLHLGFNKTDKLTETQIKRTWRNFIKNKDYCKVFIEKKRTNDNLIINSTMYFKNGKLHNEFNWAVEEIMMSVDRKYYLNGKRIYIENETSWSEYVINWKRFNRLGQILKELKNENL